MDKEAAPALHRQVTARDPAHTPEELARGERPGYGDALDDVLGLDAPERSAIVAAWWREAEATVPSTRPKGRAERPDPGGCVLRGAAATGIAELSRFGNAPKCRVGAGGKHGLVSVDCDREAVMEIYGIEMCEVHGEEAALGALEEIREDLDGEVRALTDAGGSRTSPHLSAALDRGRGVVEAYDDLATDPALLAAFPLRPDQACRTILAHAEDPDARSRRPTTTSGKTGSSSTATCASPSRTTRTGSWRRWRRSASRSPPNAPTRWPWSPTPGSSRTRKGVNSERPRN